MTRCTRRRRPRRWSRATRQRPKLRASATTRTPPAPINPRAGRTSGRRTSSRPAGPAFRARTAPSSGHAHLQPAPLGSASAEREPEVVKDYHPTRWIWGNPEKGRPAAVLGPDRGAAEFYNPQNFQSGNTQDSHGNHDLVPPHKDYRDGTHHPRQQGDAEHAGLLRRPGSARPAHRARHDLARGRARRRVLPLGSGGHAPRLEATRRVARR